MEESELKKRLWLNCVCGHSPKLINSCVSKVGTAEEIFSGRVDEKALRKILGYRFNELKNRDFSEASEIIEQCSERGIRITHISDPEYPNLLKNIDVPPQLLYMLGEDFNLNDYLCVSVVGTRHATAYGLNFARKLCYDIAGAGVVVVSGMALGLDAAAHGGALDAMQRTVAVLAGGVDVVYPRENQDLYEKILKCGMIISERPPGCVGKAELYHERNRIIAGLSYGTVIVEGAKRSGTSITARYAQEYNRDIFAVPGRPDDNKSYVPNSLIRDGAITTLSSDDVIDEYSSLYGDLLDSGVTALKSESDLNNETVGDMPVGSNKKKSKAKPKTIKKTVKKPDFSGYDKTDRTILEYLCDINKPAHIDEIIRNTGLKTSDVNSAVILLQLKGIIKQYAGNLYSLEI